MSKADGRDLCSMLDEAVVILAQAGDEDALEHIIARYRNYVYSKANTYFLVGAEKDDVAQEGMIGLYKAVKEYDGKSGSSFKSFAGLCISRQILSAIKAATRKKHLPLNSYVSFYEDTTSGEGEDNGIIYTEDREQNPEEIVILRESQDMMEYKINTLLSKLEFQVFMYYIEGMSYEEISARVGKSVKSIDNALCRIKKKLS